MKESKKHVVVGDVELGRIPMGVESSNTPAPDNKVDLTYNHESLSAKYCYPNVSQDIPEEGRNQYMK